MIIAQISDTHIALDTPDCAQRIQDFEDTIADINALDPAPDVIIHTGDIVQNGRMDEYAVTAGILAKAKAPTYLMVGNKDDRANLDVLLSAMADHLTRLLDGDESGFMSLSMQALAPNRNAEKRENKAKAAQHTLTQSAFHHIQHVFHAAVD